MRGASRAWDPPGCGTGPHHTAITVSQAPREAPARKFVPAAVYLGEKTDEQKKEEVSVGTAGPQPRDAPTHSPAFPQLLSAMVARLGNRRDPLPQDSFEGVDEAEWVSEAGIRGRPRGPGPGLTEPGLLRTRPQADLTAPRGRRASPERSHLKGTGPAIKAAALRPWLLCLCDGTEAGGRGEMAAALRLFSARARCPRPGPPLSAPPPGGAVARWRATLRPAPSAL